MEPNLSSGLAPLSPRHGPDNIRIPWVGDGQGTDTEIFSTSCAELIIVAGVVVDSSLGQYSIVLDPDLRRGGVLLAMMTNLLFPFLKVFKVCL